MFVLLLPLQITATAMQLWAIASLMERSHVPRRAIAIFTERRLQKLVSKHNLLN